MMGKNITKYIFWAHYLISSNKNTLFIKNISNLFRMRVPVMHHLQE